MVKELAILIPILVPLGLFAMIFGIVYMQKRENLAMIDKGMNPKNKVSNSPEPYKNLKWGLLLIGAGLGLFLAMIFEAVLPAKIDGDILKFALVAIFGGAGLVISYRMELKELKEREKNNRVINSPEAPAEL